MGITKTVFGKLEDGREAYRYEMTNQKGMCVTVSNYGGAIIRIVVPDRDGKMRDVALGFDSFEEYASTFFGVAVGRVANRIGNARFTLDGTTYELEKNDHGLHHLHGGSKGFNCKLWDAEVAGNTLKLSLFSPDGDSGYPGNLTVHMDYTLTEENGLRIDYLAETDSKTVCNLTNHSFFNLDGHDAGVIYDHTLQINASHVTAVDENLIPTGELKDVTGTAYDFRTAKPIGRDIAAVGLGYDDNFVLDANVGTEADPSGIAAVVYAPTSGITMTVKTDSPGVQLYTSNFLDGTVPGKGGYHYQKHGAYCLETQIFPDAVNHPHFPSCVVEKDHPQRFYTEYLFS